MGSQANRLMGCLFHPSSLAPEGGAPAEVDVTCIARRARLNQLRPKRMAPVPSPSCFSSREGLTLKPPKHDSVGKVQVSYEPFSHRPAEPARGNGLLAEATAPNRLGWKPSGLRRAKARFFQLIGVHVAKHLAHFGLSSVPLRETLQKFHAFPIHQEARCGLPP